MLCIQVGRADLRLNDFHLGTFAVSFASYFHIALWTAVEHTCLDGGRLMSPTYCKLLSKQSPVGVRSY